MIGVTRSPVRCALILGVAAAVLAFAMSVLVQHFDFTGTDTLAADAGTGFFEVGALTSWSPLAESVMFALQAGLGGAVLGACLGALGRRSRARARTSQTT